MNDVRVPREEDDGGNEAFDAIFRSATELGQKALASLLTPGRVGVAAPVVLIGAGLAWLAFSRPRDESGSRFIESGVGHFEVHEGYDEADRLVERLKARAQAAAAVARNGFAEVRGRFDRNAVRRQADPIRAADLEPVVYAGVALLLGIAIGAALPRGRR